MTDIDAPSWAGEPADESPAGFGPFSRRQLLAVGGAAATAGLAGCSGAGDGEETTTATDTTVPSGGELVVGTEAAFDNLDPHQTKAALAWTVVYNVCETLLTVEDGDLAGRLATDWSVSEDGLTYTLTIREGVQFHPPVDRELVADDVVYSLNRMRSETAAMSDDLSAVSSVEATGDHEVRVTLSEPFGPFLPFLARVPWVVVPREAVEAQGGDVGDFQRPVGTGPFRFAEHVQGDHLTLKAVPDHWIGDVPHLDAVRFTPVPDADARVLALRDGDVDVARGIPGADAGTLTDRTNVDVIRQEAASWGQVHVNCAREPWDDPAVRRAVAHVVDRDAIVSAGLFGYGDVTWQPYPADSDWHVDIGEARRERDVERAREILREAGNPLDGETLVVETTRAYQLMESTAEVLRSNLEAAGIDARIDVVGWNAMLHDFVSGDFDAMAFSVPYKIDPDRHFFGFLHPDGPQWNNYGPDQPDAQRMYDLAMQGRRQTDQAAREETYAELQRLVSRNVPWISIAHGDGLLGRRESVVGYQGWRLPYTRFWTLGKR
ncbi:MAG: ABC transporter substrate-binding protein [Halobacteriaceae archaeon]